MTTYRLHWEINERDANKTIKQYLQEQEISRRALTEIKYSGGKIEVNGKGVTVRYQLQIGDMLEVVFPPETPSKHIQGEKLSISILYEDEDILVLEKPSGISSIPSREHPSGTVANAITWHYENNGENRQIHIVTRLDRDTSGLMLVAKHRHAHHLLSKMQKNKQIERIYEAFASGVMQESEGIIEAPIGRKETSIVEREVRKDGQYACTRYKVLKQYQHFCHLRLQLVTGRTHQIRVHLSYCGHPLLGDDLYGGSQEKITRQALHCCFLRLRHPLTKEELVFRSRLPADMVKFL